MSYGTNRVVGVDGGPRKGWNTALAVQAALDGAREKGAETSLYRLYDMDFKGCKSCFACKSAKGYLGGDCYLKDGLTPLLDALKGAKGVVMGSPVYLGDVTACMRAFWERYIFSNLAYDSQNPSVLAAGPSCVVIYTMNVPREAMAPFGYEELFKGHAGFLRRLNGASVEQIAVCDTLQFDDYSLFHAPMFDEAHKRKVREEAFPLDLKKAREAGGRLASSAGA
ncbi:MAG: flavodoxin family protein [Deltaproteobacteria bacterium]|jgi:multimeric flavodoxin WrbA|nr:flavodoxin family protein [Deltaproteobacteria bacterium]